jgi:hypothetical protein
MRRSLLVIFAVAVVAAGCSGDSGPRRTLAGGSYEKDLGLTLVVDRVELGEDETLAYIRIRNPTARKFTFDPTSSALLVDGQAHKSDLSANRPAVLTDVGSGGGESTGVVVFPAVPTDATSYVLQIRGTSDNSTIGEEGLVTWNVALS